MMKCKACGRDVEKDTLVESVCPECLYWDREPKEGDYYEWKKK